LHSALHEEEQERMGGEVNEPNSDELVRRIENQGDDERGTANISGVRVQLWLGFAGTVLAALIGLIGTLFAGR
jgi:hypothetical protein